MYDTWQRIFYCQSTSRINKHGITRVEKARVSKKRNDVAGKKDSLLIAAARRGLERLAKFVSQFNNDINYGRIDIWCLNIKKQSPVHGSVLEGL